MENLNNLNEMSKEDLITLVNQLVWDFGDLHQFVEKIEQLMNENKHDNVFVVSNGEAPICVFKTLDKAQFVAENKDLVWIDEIKFGIYDNKSVVNTWKYVNNEWTSDSDEWNK